MTYQNATAALMKPLEGSNMSLEESCIEREAIRTKRLHDSPVNHDNSFERDDHAPESLFPELHAIGELLPVALPTIKEGLTEGGRKRSSGNKRRKLVCLGETKEADVLFGRHKCVLTHPGNQRFRQLVNLHFERYQEATLREHKARITADLIDTVHNAGGRFVKLDKESGHWNEVDKAVAYEKVSHALRSAKHPDLSRTCKVRPSKPPSSKAEPLTAAEEETFQSILLAQEQVYMDLMHQHALSL